MTPLVISRLRRQRPGVALTVLDLGCGTGITAAMLEACGFVVTGVDASPGMLDVAARRVGPRTTLVRGGLHEPPPGPYDAILCLFDTLNHLGGLDELGGVFGALAAQARPGTLFIFDVTTLLNHRTWQFEGTFDTDPPVRVTARCDPAGAWVEMTVTGRGTDGTVWTETHHEVAFPLADVERLLAETGWGSVRWSTYADLTATLDDPESVRRAVAECVRR